MLSFITKFPLKETVKHYSNNSITIAYIYIWKQPFTHWLINTQVKKHEHFLLRSKITKLMNSIQYLIRILKDISKSADVLKINIETYPFIK